MQRIVFLRKRRAAIVIQVTRFISTRPMTIVVEIPDIGVGEVTRRVFSFGGKCAGNRVGVFSRRLFFQLEGNVRGNA